MEFGYDLSNLRDLLEEGIEASASDTIFIGRDVDRLPNTSCISIPGWSGETAVMQLDLAGFAISSGSACSSGSVSRSEVLNSLGYDDVTAGSAIRVSLGPYNTEEEVLKKIEDTRKLQKI